MLTNSSMGRDNYSISSALTQATGTPYQRYKTYVEDPSTLEGKTDSRTHNLRPNYSMFETLEEEMNSTTNALRLTFMTKIPTQEDIDNTCNELAQKLAKGDSSKNDVKIALVASSNSVQ